MKTNINENPMIEYAVMPAKWLGKEGYQYRIEDHHADGWRDIEAYELDEQTQRLGALVYNEETDKAYYEIIQKTQQEIEQEVLQEASQKQSVAFTKLLESKLKMELQEETDDEKIIENKDAYPIWEATGEMILMGTKLQAFNSKNELSIFRCNQDILATAQFEPRLAVYAYDEIVMGGDYAVWQQPQAHNPYMQGAIVWYPENGTQLYISTINNNVHAPLVVPGAWEIYEK